MSTSQNVLKRAAQGGSDFDLEHRLLMPDGSIKHLRDLARCLRDEAGNEEVVGAIMDITERRVTEEASGEAKPISPKRKESVTPAASVQSVIG